MFFVLKYNLSSDYLEKRAPLRAEHLEMIKSFHNSDELQMAGAFEDLTQGALLIFKTEDESRVEEFVNRDPYYLNGLIKSYTINKWNCVFDKTGILI